MSSLTIAVAATKPFSVEANAGQIRETHSISAGLDYPGVGPEHGHLKDSGRASYVAVTDEEALQGFELLSRTEGIIPALESAHAIFHAAKLAESVERNQMIAVCLSGRGDKDIGVVAAAKGVKL